VHVGKLGEVTNFTIMGDNAKHCIDQYMVLFRYGLLGGDTAMPGGLHARLCHAFLVSPDLSAMQLIVATANWVALQHVTQFAVAATNHIALRSVEMRSDEMRSDDRNTVLVAV